MTYYPMLDDKLATLRNAIEGGVKADSMQALKLMELVDAIGEQFKRELDDVAPLADAAAIAERDDVLTSLYYTAREMSKRDFLDIARAALATTEAPMTDAIAPTEGAPRRCQSCGNDVAPGMDADHEDWCSELGWKKRALEAEELNRKFIASVNGPAHMGEPVIAAPSPEAPAVDALCSHRIADVRNEVVKSGYMCLDCGALFAAADHASEPKALTDAPDNAAHVMRRIRRCENETAAQVVLEHFGNEQRRAALEEAAKVCDEKSKDYDVDFEPARAAAAWHCVNAIRALAASDIDGGAV